MVAGGFADVKQCARYLGITIAYNSDRPRYDKSPNRPNIYWDDYGSSFRVHGHTLTWIVAVHEGIHMINTQQSSRYVR